MFMANKIFSDYKKYGSCNKLWQQPTTQEKKNKHVQIELTHNAV
jgi:hypothetical protein